MKRTTLLIGLTALAIGATGLTFATSVAARNGHGGPGEAMEFTTFDTDSDGQITQAELDAHREARFAELDTDGDGSVTLEEFKAAAAGRAGEFAEMRFSRLDADGDGVLSRDAIEAQGHRRGGRGGMIEHLDADGDGMVSETEFDEMKNRRADFRKMKRRGHGDR